MPDDTEAEDDGLTLAMTPVQLAAALSDEGAVYQGESDSNRFWGGLRAVGGIAELVGAGLLLAAPEPTMATKAGGIVLGAHGLDTVQSGARQLWTGKSTRSLTEQGASALALQLGADKEAAENIGTAVDIAVPIIVSVGVGAARVMAVRGGRISLAAHEAAAGSKIGGHTIAKHVAQTEAQMMARMQKLEAAHKAGKLKKVPDAISSFKSLEAAEKALYQAIRANKKAIEAWAKTAAKGSKQPFTYTAAEDIGEGVVRATGKLTQMRKLRFVLKMEEYNGKPFYILTAFPEL
jgi:hypothetical protein